MEAETQIINTKQESTPQTDDSHGCSRNGPATDPRRYKADLQRQPQHPVPTSATGHDNEARP